MKKLLAVILVFTLVLSMGSLAFATPDPEPPYVDGSPVKIDKNLVSQGENPEEVFNFTVGVGSYSGPIEKPTVPVIDGFSITVAQGEASGTANITLPNFAQVGVYTYPITEITGDTAGFVYDTVPKDLKITVINNPDYDAEDENSEKFLRVLTMTRKDEDGKNIKVDAFENEFYAGDLVITKEITGNNAVFDDEFEVTVVLTPDEGKYIKEGPISIEGASSGLGSVAKNEDGTVTIKFMVSHESEVTIANIPYNVTYAVTEAAGDYTATIENATGQINSSTKNVNITNDRDRTIETGINLDNLPYILILGAATLGLVGFTMRKRFNNRQ